MKSHSGCVPLGIDFGTDDRFDFEIGSQRSPFYSRITFQPADQRSTEFSKSDAVQHWETCRG